MSFLVGFVLGLIAGVALEVACRARWYRVHGAGNKRDGGAR